MPLLPSFTMLATAARQHTVRLGGACALILSAAVLPHLARAQQAPRGGTLVYGERPPILRSLNPYASAGRDGPTDRILSMIYEPLFRFNFNKEEWESVLALDIKKVQPKSKGGASAFAVSLRSTTWHDGSPFKPSDVVFTYDYARKAWTSPSSKQFLTDLLADVRETGASEVTFEFTRPIESVDGAKEYLRDYIIPLSRFNRVAWTPISSAKDIATAPLGTGPYRFVNYQGGNPMLARHDGFHGGPGNLDKIEYRYGVDVSSLLDGLLSANPDGINLMVELPPEEIQRVESKSGLKVSPVASFNVIAVEMRQKPNSILNSEKVRRAITMAINTEQLLKNWFITGELLASPVMQQAPSYDSRVLRIPYDQEGARRILREESATGRDLSFIYPTDVATDGHVKDVVHSMAEALAAVGLKVKERALTKAQFEEAHQRGDYDLAWTRWEFNPAYDITPIFRSKNAPKQSSANLNTMGFSDVEFDRLAAEYETADDDSRRRGLMQAMQKVLNEKAPAIFLVSDVKNFAYSIKYRIPDGTVDPFRFFTYAYKWFFKP